MDTFSPTELLAETDAALAVFNERERRFWSLVRIPPATWEQHQYPGEELVWVGAVVGRRSLYFNPVEEGWGWGQFETWGVVGKFHWQQDEIQQAIAQTLFEIDNRGDSAWLLFVPAVICGELLTATVASSLLALCSRSLLGSEADVGSSGDFDQLNAASEDSHRCEHDDAGFDYFSIADEIKPHSQEVKAEENEEPAGDFSSFKHGDYFPVA